MVYWNVDEWHRAFLKKTGIRVNEEQCVLDVGCGDGRDCQILSECVERTVGIDIQPNANWARKGNADYMIAEASNLPFKNESFDIVFGKDVLHHVNEPERALNEMKRVTKAGGSLVIVEANRYNPILYIHMTIMKGHQHFTRKRFSRLLRTTSLDEIKLMSVESHVYPTSNSSILKLFHLLESLLERIPVVRYFLSYNIGIAKKEG